MEKVRVSDDACIGCGACVATVPDVFDLSDETGTAYVTMKEIPDEYEEDVLLAVDGCPTNAIVVGEDAEELASKEE